MAFSLPTDLATNWADNVGMIENAAYLNAVGDMNNKLKSALTGTVNGTAGAVVATSESTTSVTYTDLTTTTDTVTVTIGASGMALVLLYANLSANGAHSFMSYAVSGATISAAADTKAIEFMNQYNAANGSLGATFLETGLTAGSTTFKAKYRTSNGSYGATFANRRIAVIPFF